MKTKVLVIDDDASIRESMRRVLEREDYEVLPAADAQEAVDCYDPAEIGLLLLDINLPLRNGWEAFEQITAKNPCLPIIIITGHPDQDRVAKFAGASAFMEKPIDAVQLLQTIERLLAEPGEQRLRRLLGRGDCPRLKPADAQQIFADLQTRYSTPFRFARPAGNCLSAKSNDTGKTKRKVKI